MRSGAELVRASQVYAREDAMRSWRLVLITIALAVGLEAVILTSSALWVQLPASILLGLVGVRLFILFHDWAHNAILRDSKIGTVLMTGVGFYTLSAPSVWRETHNYHHIHNAKLVGSTIGSYPTVSLNMYRSLTPTQRRKLRFVRHPLTIALGFFTVFLLGMCWTAWRRDPKTHRLIPVAVGTWFGVFGLLMWQFGVRDAVLGMLLPCMFHSALGSYLFYAQHNFPDAKLRGRRSWDYTHAALYCSSYFEMSRPMHWLTGNIGYHHVHHLNHRIPFYRLPEAMAAMPELQSPGRTSWSPRDVLACFRCSVWDEDADAFVSFREAEASALEALAQAAK